MRIRLLGAELRAALHEEMSVVSSRLNDMQQQLSGDLRDNVNSLASMIGEMDGRLHPAGHVLMNGPR